MEYLPEADSNGSYINESERNVHVWSSIVRSCTYQNLIGKPTLGLIAGKLGICHRTYFVPLISRLVCTQARAGRFRVLSMARQHHGTPIAWLDLLDGSTSLCNRFLIGFIEIENMVLFRCTEDPRKMSLPTGPIPLPSDLPLERHSRSPLNEGHYMIYLYGNSGSIHPQSPMLMHFFPDKRRQNFLSVWPPLVSAEFKRRSRDLHAFSRRHTISCKSPFL